MLDVHPPHAPTHTWKDFFIHIATIVIGLIIAVGLEQTVEWVHHKSEVRETREFLAEERTQNIDTFHANVRKDRRAVAFLENNLRIFKFLQQHPGTPREKLPGVPYWDYAEVPYAQSAWTSAGHANILALMPKADVDEAEDLYGQFAKDLETQSALVDTVRKAEAYKFIEPDPSKLTKEQVDDEIPLIEDCLRILLLDMDRLSDLADVHADFSPGPSLAELVALLGNNSGDPSKDFPAAWAFTLHDFDNVRELNKADRPTLELVTETLERGAGHLTEVYNELHAKYPDLNPGEKFVNGFGYIALRNGDIPGAINVFTFNAQRHPNSWNVYDSLGEAYAKAGKKKLAIENYQHAHQLSPNAPSPREALARLQR